MSSADTLARPAAPRGAVAATDLRFLGSELRLVMTRRRNLALLAVLAMAPVLIGVAVKVTAADVEPGDGPPFFASITQNGIFLAFTALVAALPAFLPLAVGVVSGEAVAGEANLGTLRYLLVTPVNRTRLLAVKYVSVVFYGLVAALVVAASGVITGALLFPVGDVTLISGSTVGYGDGLLRALLVALYVAACLAAVAAIGVFVSTLTEVPIAAMATTVVLVLVLEILDSIPQLDFLDQWLMTHHWLAFGDLLRDPIALHAIGVGLLVQLGWVAVMLAAAWARLTSKDVTS
ncbi:ABC transporter permease [Angustibacter aerolatus]